MQASETIANSSSSPVPDFRSEALRAQELCTQLRWREALAIYRQLELVNAHALIDHAQALCLVGMGDFASALLKLDVALSKDPQHWVSSLLKARVLTHQRRMHEAHALLMALKDHAQAGADASVDLGLLQLTELGDPVAARTSLEPFIQHPVLAEKAAFAWWVTQLYDRDLTALQLTQHLVRLGRQYLNPVESSQQAFKQFRQGVPVRRFTKRRRIGLVSPVFTASPVYFLTFSTLQALSRQADLVFYNRSEKQGDWATQQFKRLASEWRDCSQLDPLTLARQIVVDQVDAMIDLGGWMDWGALKALAFRPAPRQLKWVGGQSTSTGLNCFDGFVCDQWHVPENLSWLYSEPLIRVPGGYTDYTPPAYMPKAVPADTRTGGLGIIANPNKLSRDFLRHVAVDLVPDCESSNTPLLFIERRFEHAAVRQRVVDALQQAGLADAQKRVDDGMIRFSAPRNHPAFLAELGQLTELIDTFPYSSGLTAVEAHALDVPIRVRSGELFCERHSLALAEKNADPAGQQAARGSLIAQHLLDYL